SDVAGIFHHVADGLQPRFQPGDTHRRWPHIDAAPRSAQVERDSDHADFFAARRVSGGYSGGRYQAVSCSWADYMSATDKADAAFWGTESSRARVPDRRSKLRPAQSPFQNPTAARRHTGAEPSTP